MMHNKKTAKVGLLLTSLLMATTACGTSPAVKSAQKFGELGAQFKDNTNRLADDIYGSCVRRTRYMQVDDRISNNARNKAIQKCEALNRPASIHARDANKIVVDYMEAIGKLAADDVVSFENQLNRIEESLKNFSIPGADGTLTTLPGDAVSTGVSIAEFLFGWIANEFREGALKEAVTCTDKPLQTYISGLKTAFSEGYVDGLLEQEQFRIISYYNYYAGLLRSNKASDTAFRSLQKDSFEAIERNLNQRTAALSYLAIIDRTANDHGALAKLFLDGDQPPSESYCEATYFSRGDSESDVSKAEVSPDLRQNLTAEEYIQVEQILSDYYRDITPLLVQMQQELEEE